MSELLTATAVLQQVEQGELHLHADVDLYLDEVQVPEAFGETVTAAHLLTHTAGMGLAGQLVEGVSGEAFADYVTAHILDPLGMTRSTYG